MKQRYRIEEVQNGFLIFVNESHAHDMYGMAANVYVALTINNVGELLKSLQANPAVQGEPSVAR